MTYETGEIQEFWTQHPVGADFTAAEDWPEFFRRYDERRYRNEPHILGELERLVVGEKAVLELGLGQGSESQWLAERAGSFIGADLTDESVRRVRERFALVGTLQDTSLTVANGERLPFPDNSFDIVFSHGVIHHSPRIRQIIGEIHRVLKPGGRAVVMVYHRHSLNYHVSIRFVRRFGIGLLVIPGVAGLVSKLTGEPRDRLLVHLDNFKHAGFGYLRMRNFIHKATDGPHNVFSSVFSRREARRLFSAFADVQTRVFLLNERHFPGLRSLLNAKRRDALEKRYGWHLWIYATKRATNE